MPWPCICALHVSTLGVPNHVNVSAVHDHISTSARRPTLPWPRQHFRKQTNGCPSVVHVNILFFCLLCFINHLSPATPVGLHASQHVPDHLSMSASRPTCLLCGTCEYFFSICFVSLNICPPTTPAHLQAGQCVCLRGTHEYIFFICFNSQIICP